MVGRLLSFWDGAMLVSGRVQLVVSLWWSCFILVIRLFINIRPDSGMPLAAGKIKELATSWTTTTTTTPKTTTTPTRTKTLSTTITTTNYWSKHARDQVREFAQWDVHFCDFHGCPIGAKEGLLVMLVHPWLLNTEHILIKNPKRKTSPEYANAGFLLSGISQFSWHDGPTFLRSWHANSLSPIIANRFVV